MSLLQEPQHSRYSRRWSCRSTAAWPSMTTGSPSMSRPWWSTKCSAPSAGGQAGRPGLWRRKKPLPSPHPQNVSGDWKRERVGLDDPPALVMRCKFSQIFCIEQYISENYCFLHKHSAGMAQHEFSLWTNIELTCNSLILVINIALCNHFYSHKAALTFLEYLSFWFWH